MSGAVRPSGRPIPLLTPGSPEWLRRMSASKIAAVVGLSPYQSRYSLWMQMAGLTPQPEQTAAMAGGHYLEPAVAAWFADQHPEWRVETCGTFVHVEHDWMVASPDRIVTHPSGHTELLQCKSARDRETWGDVDSDDIPVGYRAQVQWEMHVAGLSTCHVAVITSFLEFRPYVVEYDAAEAAYLVGQARGFLDSLAAGERPALDGHKATYEAVRQMHPDIDDVKVDVPAELAVAYLEACAAEKDAKGGKRLAAARLLDHMGSARQAYFKGQCIARRQANGLFAAKGVSLDEIRSAA